MPPETKDFDLAACPRPWVTATMLASYLTVSPRTVIRMIHEGALPGSVKVRATWRIPTAVARAKFHVEQRHAS